MVYRFSPLKANLYNLPLLSPFEYKLSRQRLRGDGFGSGPASSNGDGSGNGYLTDMSGFLELEDAGTKIRTDDST